MRLTCWLGVTKYVCDRFAGFETALDWRLEGCCDPDKSCHHWCSAGHGLDIVDGRLSP